MLCATEAEQIARIVHWAVLTRLWTVLRASNIRESCHYGTGGSQSGPWFFGIIRLGHVSPPILGVLGPGHLLLDLANDYVDVQSIWKQLSSIFGTSHSLRWIDLPRRRQHSISYLISTITPIRWASTLYMWETHITHSKTLDLSVQYCEFSTFQCLRCFHCDQPLPERYKLAP